VTAGLALVRRVAAADHFLAVLVTIDAAGAPQVSLVNAGVLPHPLTATPCVGLVARGGTAKLGNLRRRPHATVVFRAGWEWSRSPGRASLPGPTIRCPAWLLTGCPGCCGTSSMRLAAATPIWTSTTG
jgi:hypothetical protein